MHKTMIAFAFFAVSPSALAAPQAGFQLLPVPARIDVSGYGEVKYMPDVATIAYIIRGEGPTSDEAVRAMAASAVRVSAAVHAIDATAEPKTSEIKIAAVRSTDCKEHDYGPPQLSSGACAISGYVATQSVTLRTTAVKDSGTLVGLVGRAGALNPRIEGFTVRDSRPQQQQAIAAALADAASKAAAIAAASHVQLGPILNVTSGPRNDAQQIILSGSRRLTVNTPPPPPAPPVRVDVVPELLTTTSYVTVVYSINQ
ncbi:MAG TPA: SIMPL domain-containing protein [Sphingomicrobium sp.]|nr:SIMPL domain-containing protein [Sphingomicrobium sp.]